MGGDRDAAAPFCRASRSPGRGCCGRVSEGRWGETLEYAANSGRAPFPHGKLAWLKAPLPAVSSARGVFFNVKTRGGMRCATRVGVGASGAARRRAGGRADAARAQEAGLEPAADAADRMARSRPSRPSSPWQEVPVRGRRSAVLHRFSFRRSRLGVRGP